MKKQITVFLLIMVMLISATGWFYLIYASDKSAGGNPGDILYNPKMRRMLEIIDLVKTSYYREVDEDELIDNAVNGMLETLDPHSVYISKDTEIQNFNMMTTGEFGGIGFRVGIRDGQVTVISPIDNTPASRKGIRAGDVVLKIDTTSTEGMDIDDAVSLMRGDPGTKVKLLVERYGNEIEFDIVREMIQIKSIPYYGMVDDSTGYIRMTQFANNVDREFKAALDELFNKDGAKKLILDLRQNPGGLLPMARDISDFFLPKGLVVVSTRSHNEELNTELLAEKPIYKGFFPLTVLVDEGSASASEIVAGAVQDWDRGIILGDTTFGKGSVQSVFDFSKINPGDKGILKFTTFRYFTPSGRSIDRELIKYEKGKEDTSKYYSLGELRRELKGGGGIIPDYVHEERRLSLAEIDIIRKQLSFGFVVEYLKNHKPAKEIAMNMPEDILNSYFKYLEDNDIEMDSINSDSAIYNSVVRELDLEFARQIGGEQYYYKVLVAKDNLVNKARELMTGSLYMNEMIEKLGN